MQKYFKNILYSLIPVFSLTCSTNYFLVSKINNFAKKNIVLLEPLIMSAFFNIKLDNDKFNNNMYIGNIIYSGGYTRNLEKGNIIQSKYRSFIDQTRMKNHIVSLYSSMIKEVMKNNNIRYVNQATDLDPSEINKLIKFDVESQRLKDAMDGKDNINLPRKTYRLAKIEQKYSDQLIKKYNSDYLMIPVIEYYYGHNGGWFNDQEFGCGAGARFSVYLYVINLKSRVPVFEFKDVENRLFNFKFNISNIEIDQEFFNLENNLKNKLYKVIR